MLRSIFILSVFLLSVSLAQAGTLSSDIFKGRFAGFSHMSSSTIEATSADIEEITGHLTGNVTGNLTGNITGGVYNETPVATEAELIAANASGSVTSIIVTTSLTLNSTISITKPIRVTPGAIITTTTGHTLTFNGPFDGAKSAIIGTGTVVFNISEEKLLNSRLSIGDRRGATNSSDSVILASRKVNDSESGNGHCFSDSSDITRGGTIAYASYDARFTVSGTENYGHFAPFQNGLTYSSSGATSYLYGFVDVPAMTAGTVDKRFGIRVAEINKSGGTLNYNYGLWVDELTKGTSNYAIRTIGTTPSLFEGVITVGGLTTAGNIYVDGAVYGGAYVVGLDSSAAGTIAKSASAGLKLTSVTGSAYDAGLMNAGSTLYVWRVPTGTNTFSVIGKLNLGAVSTYADNAAALAGGLVAGDVYRTASGVLMIVY